MSAEAVAWARETTTGSPGAKLVLLILADYADEGWRSDVTQQTIADATEQGVRTVRRHLARLEASSLISRQPPHPIRLRPTTGQIDHPPGQNGRPRARTRPPGKLRKPVEARSSATNVTGLRWESSYDGSLRSSSHRPSPVCGKLGRYVENTAVTEKGTDEAWAFPTLVGLIREHATEPSASDGSVLKQWLTDGRDPRDIADAIRGFRAMVDEGALSWLSPGERFHLKALHRRTRGRDPFTAAVGYYRQHVAGPKLEA